MAIEPFDFEAAAMNLAQREEKRRAGVHARFAQATGDFRRIVDMIARKYRPRRIFQWGSLLDERRFSEISDIDIAVEGCRCAEDFFAMYGEADAMTDLPLDLIELEKVDPLHAHEITTKGKLIYENSDAADRTDRPNR